MPEHQHYEEDDLFNPDTAHEHSDVPIGTLLWFIAIFIVLSVVTHFVILFFYKGMVKAERGRVDPPQTAVTRPANADVPQNQPLLQPFPRTDAKGVAIPPQSDTPVTDMARMREDENLILGNYGWVDKQAGVVRMPIAVAKEVLAARIAVQGQLGTAAAAPVPPAAPSTTPAPSGQPVPADTGTAPATDTGAQQ